MEKSLATTIKKANETLINHGKLNEIGDFFTSNYTTHLTERTMKGGHNTVRNILQSLHQSFPDIQVEVDILVESESRIAWQRTLCSTHKGKFKGFPASDLQIVV